jgi:hypothetical protein
MKDSRMGSYVSLGKEVVEKMTEELSEYGASNGGKVQKPYGFGRITVTCRRWCLKEDR